MSSNNNLGTKPSNRLIRWPEVERLAGIKRGHAHHLIKEDRFPAPLKLAGGRASAWVLSEVQDWVDQRIAEARGVATVSRQSEGLDK